MEKETIHVKQRLNHVVNYICNIHLTSFKIYREMVAKTFDYFHKVPLVLNEGAIYIFTKGYKNYNNMAINYNKISKIEKNDKHFIVTFHSGNKLNINMPIKTYFKTIKQIHEISDYLAKINY